MGGLAAFLHTYLHKEDWKWISLIAVYGTPNNKQLPEIGKVSGSAKSGEITPANFEMKTMVEQ